jgi:hypothetical protein
VFYKTKTVFLRLACALALATASLSASQITFSTGSGASTGGGPVSATAQVTTGANSVTVTLTDLLANPTDVAQLISDFSFTLSDGFTALNTTSTPIASTLCVGVSPCASTVSSWFLTSSGNTITLEALGQPGPELIIGPGPYTNANGSINGNGPHNPFLNGTATFTFAVNGVTADTTASAAIFSFGTALGVTIPGDPTSATPEPGTITMGLIGIGLWGAGTLARRRRRV